MAGPRGPMPNPNRRRRNEPTIPTTALPAGGRKGGSPKVPKWIELGEAGKAWWRWAWSTPQAAAWARGMEVVVARRARLEDDLVALGEVRGVLDLLETAGITDRDDLAQHLRFVLGHLKAVAVGKLAIEKAMLEIEDRLGLSPKAMAALRWEIVGDAPKDRGEDGDAPPPGVTDLEKRRRRLTADAS